MSDVKLRDVLANAVNSGKFGENLKFLDLTVSSKEGEDHFASDTVFAKVKLQNGSSVRSVSVVIKRQQSDQFTREMMNSDVQFYNEATMYNEVLPFLEKNGIVKDIFPESFYCNSTFGKEPENDIVIIEDLRPKGFRLAEEKIFLDYNHCEVTLKKLGRFHALSYAMKKDNPEMFFEKSGKLRDVTWGNDEESGKFLKNSIERGVIPLIEAGEHVEKLKQFLNKFDDHVKFLQEIRRPEEPVAVICHGDFNRNNILFKYDDSGNPTDVMFFDVATSRYSSPAIDLAFFLCMNTSSDLRKAHWDDLLKVYHESLTSAVPNCEVPSLEELRQDLSRKAVYGYFICSFFIPMMMDSDRLVDFSTLSPEEIDELSRTRGGEQATKRVSDVVRDLVRFNCLE